MFLPLIVVATVIVLYCLISSVYHIEYVRLATKDLAYAMRGQVIKEMQKQVSFFKAPMLKALTASDIHDLQYISPVLLMTIGAWIGLVLLSAFLLLLPVIFLSVVVVVVIATVIIRRAHSKAKKETSNGKH